MKWHERVITRLLSLGDDRGGDVPKIRAILAKYPGVTVLDVVGWDEIWPFFGPVNIRAEVMVRGSGPLRLCNLTPATVRGRAPFILAGLGGWYPYVLAERDLGKARFVAGCPNSVDIGPGSAFLELVPFTLQTPWDVIDHYERLHEVLLSWPEDRWRRTWDKNGMWIDYIRGRVVD